MSRYIGNYLRVPSSEPQQASAPGIWSLSEQLNYQRANLWPPARDPYYNQTVLHLSGDVAATRETNPVTQPRTFLSDASSNNFLLTPNGDVSARPFSPYGTSWSTYFVPTANASTAGSNFSIASPTPGLSFGTSDFTVECWVNKIKAQNVLILDTRSGITATPWAFCIDGSNCPYFYDGTSYTSTVPITLNQWTHIAVTRASGTLRIFVNGIQGYSATVTTNLDRTAGAIIGAKVVTPDNAFDGYLSSLRVVKGQALYTTTFTPSTAPLTTTSQGAIASNVSLLAFQSNRFIDLTNNFTLTPSNSPSISQNSPFVEYDTTSGSGYFDGNADYLIAGDQTAFEFGAGDYTVECWWYPTTTTDQNIIGKWDAGGSEWILQWRSAGYYRWASNGSVISDTSSITLRLNAWNHISVTKTSGSLRIYSNGSQINTTASEGTISATTAQLTIGTSQLNSSPGYVTGYISDVRIVKGTAITPPANAPTTPLQVVSGTSLLTLQTRAPANNQGILDTSPNSFVVTRTGNVAQGSFSPFSQSGWSNYFLGRIGTNLNLVSNAGLSIGAGQFCVEAWVYVLPQTLTSGGYGYGTIISQGNNNNNNHWWLAIIDSTGVINWGYTGSGITVSTSYPVVKNTWTHIAVTRDASNGERIFLNGVLVNHRTNTTNYSSVNGYQMQIGTNYDSNYPSAYGYNAYANPFSGYISNLRVITGSIPSIYQTSITTLGTNVFTPPVSDLTAVAGTILLTCQNNRFKDNSPNNWTISKSGSDIISVQPFSPFAPTQAYVASQLGGSLRVSASGDIISWPQNTWNNRFSSNNWSIEAWVYPTASTSTDFFVDQWTNGTTTTSLIFTFMGGNFDIYIGSTLYTLTGITPTLNAWTHIVAVRTGGTFSVFQNGVRTHTRSDLSTGVVNNGGTANRASPGFGGGAGCFFHGHRIVIGNNVPYDATNTIISIPTAPVTAIPGTASLLLGTGAGIVDASGKHTIETVGNTHKSTAQARFTSTGADYYDGTSDYLTIKDNPLLELGSANFTIEAWVYPLNNSSRSIFGHGPDGQNWWAFYLDGTGKLEFAIVSGNSVVVDRISSTTVNTNTWTHVAVTRSGSTFRLFIDGQEPVSYTGSPAATSSATPDFSTDFWIGGQRWSGSGNGFQGYIQDLRVTRGVARYTSNFTPLTRTLELG